MIAQLDLAIAAREEMGKVGELHSCILAGSVLTKVFAREGHPDAYPLTVAVSVMNPAFTLHAQRFGLPQDGLIPDAWYRQGCRGAAIGHARGAPEGQWHGHLVVILPNAYGRNHAMFDMTISQVSRPDAGIDLGPILAEVPNSFVRGQSPHKMVIDGHRVEYMASPEDVSYRVTPVWNNETLRESIVSRVPPLERKS